MEINFKVSIYYFDLIAKLIFAIRRNIENKLFYIQQKQK